MKPFEDLPPDQQEWIRRKVAKAPQLSARQRLRLEELFRSAKPHGNTAGPESNPGPTDNHTDEPNCIATAQQAPGKRRRR
ncbi:hypothetical protein A5657_15560 [Mycobacterium kubicae]|nr:hypothetical protein A5657_15560 [Mycobacterium kubicae]